MTEIIYLAAGCFWGTQYYFDQVPGVIETTAGFTGGHVDHPTYEQVCYENTGHAEAIEVIFDPNVISLQNIIEQFLYMHYPTQANGQGPDIGEPYRSAIFFTSDEQRDTVAKTIAAAKSKFKKPIMTEVAKASAFWPAEDYHQKYSQRTGRGVCHVPHKELSK